jgi:hypothetical protein
LFFWEKCFLQQVRCAVVWRLRKEFLCPICRVVMKSLVAQAQRSPRSRRLMVLPLSSLQHPRVVKLQHQLRQRFRQRRIPPPVTARLAMRVLVTAVVRVVVKRPAAMLVAKQTHQRPRNLLLASQQQEPLRKPPVMAKAELLRRLRIPAVRSSLDLAMRILPLRLGTQVLMGMEVKPPSKPNAQP